MAEKVAQIGDISLLNLSPVDDLLETFRRKLGVEEGLRHWKTSLFELPEVDRYIRDAVDAMVLEPPTESPLGHVVLRSAGSSASRLVQNRGQWNSSIWKWEPGAVLEKDLKELAVLETHARYITEEVMCMGLVYAYKARHEPPGDTNISVGFTPAGEEAITELQKALERVRAGVPLRRFLRNRRPRVPQ